MFRKLGCYGKSSENLDAMTNETKDTEEVESYAYEGELMQALKSVTLSCGQMTAMKEVPMDVNEL